MANKRFTLVSLFFVFLSIAAGAQSVSAIDQLKADPRKAYGNDYPYHFTDAKLTASPDGYTPFYISHYGRHGSRYFYNNRLYKELDSILTAGHEAHLLTAIGESFRERFEAVKQELNTGWGELTQLGWDQHQGIARTMYRNFPEVFSEGGNVMAVSSLSGRCIMSMSAFCLALTQCNPQLNVREQSSRFTLNAVVPDDGQNPLKRDFPKSTPRYEQNRDKFHSDFQLPKIVVSRVFTSTEGLKWRDRHIGSSLISFYTTLPSINYEGMMEGIVTDEEVASEWEAYNLGSYSWVFKSRYRVIPILEDIIQKAEAVIKGESDHKADLRFGHDSYMGPLTVLLGINGADLDPEDPYEVKNCYQNWETCMASNMQLVFYRSSDPSADILVKCLLNGEEAKLPVPTQMAPYYKWSDILLHVGVILQLVADGGDGAVATINGGIGR